MAQSPCAVFATNIVEVFAPMFGMLGVQLSLHSLIFGINGAGMLGMFGMFGLFGMVRNVRMFGMFGMVRMFGI